MQPTLNELQDAFQAGFQSIDEGDTFYVGFHQRLGGLGYQYREEVPCTCSDLGAHGHMPKCRWVKT